MIPNLPGTLQKQQLHRLVYLHQPTLTPTHLSTLIDNIEANCGLFLANMTARLCEECKHLKFDDTVVSRLEYHSEDGTSYLISVDEDSALALETDYEFADFFPSLPKLEKSARDGCDCCRWLRETIQRAPITPPGPMTRVVIRAKYIWRELPQGWPNNLDHGLRALYLLVDFFPVRSVHRPLLSTSTIVLDIYSSSGM